MRTSCSLTITYVGPNIVCQCACGNFHVVKIKAHSAIAIAAAREHVSKLAKRTKIVAWRSDAPPPTPLPKRQYNSGTIHGVAGGYHKGGMK